MEIENAGMPGKRLLWLKLRDARLSGLTFVRNYRIGEFVVDYYCPQIKLGIDVESQSIALTVDNARRQALESCGVLMLHFLDQEVLEYTEEVVDHIRILVNAFGKIDGIVESSVRCSS